MTTREITAEIDALLSKAGVGAKEKRAQLRKLAKCYWKVVFPEFATPAFGSLSIEERECRWQLQRESDEMDCCVNPGLVLMVLDSPTSGDLLLWVQ
jgi:hypothetical protein